MANAYRPPQVTVEEIVSPSIAPLLAVPASICLVGLAQGFQTRTDQLTLSGTTATPLPNIPEDATLQAVLSVKDANDPSKGAADGSGYVVTTDYTVQTGGKTVTRVGAGAIADGRVVNVTYTYVSATYYVPTRLSDMGSVETRYGPAYTADGTAVNSTLSYAAAIAFENGASEVVCQPLFTLATPGDPNTAQGQPNATQAAATATWQDTLFSLRDIEDINVIVPLIGQSMTNVDDARQLAILSVVQDHVKYMKDNDQYIVALLGEDSSAASTVAQKTTLRAHAVSLGARYGGDLAEQTVLVSPSRFVRSLPLLGQSVFVGGQYVAVAVAGLLAANDVSTALTRKPLSGFNAVADPRQKLDKNADAQVGLMVIEQRGAAVRIRHSITLDTSSTERNELSVVRAKHRVVESVRDTLDTQIIGHVIADGNAPLVVRAAVISVLEQLRQDRDIVSYSEVESRAVTLDPSKVEVRFSYRPAFPLNYINVKFALDLTTGDVTPGNTDTSL